MCLLSPRFILHSCHIPLNICLMILCFPCKLIKLCFESNDRMFCPCWQLLNSFPLFFFFFNCSVPLIARWPLTPFASLYISISSPSRHASRLLRPLWTPLARLNLPRLVSRLSFLFPWRKRSGGGEGRRRDVLLGGGVGGELAGVARDTTNVHSFSFCLY